MQELRTTFFWLLIANHLALFKQILQTTYLLQIYIHCWLNSVFKIKLALFNFKIPSSDKIQLCWAFFLFFREFHSNKNTSVFHFDSCLPFKWWHKSIKNGRVLKLFLFCFIKLCTSTYSKKTILQLLRCNTWLKPFVALCRLLEQFPNVLPTFPWRIFPTCIVLLFSCYTSTYLNVCKQGR